MKYHLYQKVLSQSAFPAFQAMVTAGTEATLPTALSGIAVPPGYNTNYGIAFAQLVAGLLQGISNYLTQILSDISLSVANASATVLGKYPFTPPAQNAQQIIEDYGSGYDSYVNQCAELIQPAVFDETLFDLSAYQPAYGYEMQNSFCHEFEHRFSQLTTLVIQNGTAYDVTSLGIGKTDDPIAENLMYDALQNTGVGEALQKAGVNFFDLPDFAQYALAFLAVLNQVLSSGVALDASWFDRSAFSEPVLTPDGEYQLLADEFRLQNLSQWFGVVTDFSTLDFAILMPEFPPVAESLEDLIATLSAEKAIVSIFGQLFANHFYNPSPDASSGHVSRQAENYAETYSMYQQINNIIKKRYGNPIYAKIILSAVMEVARYTYRGNLSYQAGARSLSYDEFLKYWRNKWSFYGVSSADLDFAQKLGEQYQGASALQSAQKLRQTAGYARTYKPLFYRPGYSGVGSET